MGQNKLTPLARVVATHVVGCDPTIMGIGPAEAIRGALQKAGLTLADMDLVEVRYSPCDIARQTHPINCSECVRHGGFLLTGGDSHVLCIKRAGKVMMKLAFPQQSLHSRTLGEPLNIACWPQNRPEE